MNTYRTGSDNILCKFMFVKLKAADALKNNTKNDNNYITLQINYSSTAVWKQVPLQQTA